MVQAPDFMAYGKIDMCDDCPDMCVFEGKLVNSCRLDEYSIYGDLLTMQVDEDAMNKKHSDLEVAEA